MSEQPSQDEVDAVLAEYLAAVEAGEPVDRRAWLQRYPHLAEELQAFFEDESHLGKVAAELPAGIAPDESNVPTLAPDAGSLDPTLGTVRYLGDYELLEEIARGGMGVVYKARQVSLDRVVALKMILTGSFASEVEVQRFRREAESAANLDHPNIVPIYEVGEHESQQYFSMKFVEGGNLADLPRAQTDDEQHEAARQIILVARAVHHAHQRGILHRDLKPSNILLDEQRQPYVTDFGLAKRVQSEGTFSETGSVVGTPAYMAPEQARAEKALSVAVDVYGLGAVLYERLAGRPPFTGETTFDVIRQVLETEPTPPRSLRPNVPRDLETICLKCLSKAPGQRYVSMEALADDLDRYLEDEPIRARPAGRVERLWRWCRRHPAVASLTAVITLTLVAATLVSTSLALWAWAERDRADGNAATAKNNEDKAKQHADDEKRARLRADELVGQLRRQVFAGQLMHVGSIVERDPERAFGLLHNYQVCPIDERDAAWHVYHNACRTWMRDKEATFTPYVLTFDHDFDVSNVLLSRDGTVLAGVGRDEVKLWNTTTGQSYPPLEGPLPAMERSYPSQHHMLSLDGSTLAVRNSAYSVATGKRVGSLVEQGELLAVSPTMDTFLTRNDGRVSLVHRDGGMWSLEESAGLEASLSKRFRRVLVLFSPEGTRLLAVCSRVITATKKLTFDLYVWDTATGNLVFQRLGAVKDEGSSRFGFTHDSRTLAVHPIGPVNIEFIDLSSGKQIAEVRGLSALGREGRGTPLPLGPKGVLLRRNEKRILEFIDITTGQPRAEFDDDEVSSAAFSLDGQSVALWGEDNNVKLIGPAPLHATFDEPWRGESSHWLPTFPLNRDGKKLAFQPHILDTTDGHTKIPLPSGLGRPLCFSPKGDWLATLTENSVQRFDLATRKVSLLTRKTNHRASIRYNPDLEHLVVGWWTPGKVCDEVEVFDLNTGTKKGALTGPFEWLPDSGQPDGSKRWHRLLLSPDGTLLVTGDTDKTFAVWEVGTGRRAETMPLLMHAQFSPTENTIVGIHPFDGSMRVTLWDVAASKEKWSVEVPCKVKHYATIRTAFRTDGKRIAILSDTVARICDTATGKALVTLDGERRREHRLAFSPDGRLLAMVDGHSLRFWDAMSGKLLTEYSKRVGWKILGLTFTADSRSAIVTSPTGHNNLERVRFWRAPR